VTSSQITLLGAIAGTTILIGLPIGRMRGTSIKLRAFLNATALGVLVFLLWDVLSHAIEPVEATLTAASIDHNGSWGEFARLALVLTVGFGVGLLSLAYYERWMGTRVRSGQQSLGPGAMATQERPLSPYSLTGTPARRLALLIAVGIGLHNFSEGLAIGQSAAKGEISLAIMLVVGFGLHNATEGFGITAPLVGDSERPSWRLLLLLGLIGGGPTFVGTIIGQSVVNETLYLAFLAMAAGSILYVIVQLVGVALKMGEKMLLYYGLMLGLFAGLATDFIVTAAGA